MTDRIAELTRGESFSTVSLDDRDDESDRLLAPFVRQAEAVEKVLDWADGVFANAPAMHDATAQLDLVEQELQAVRRQLKKMADGNVVFAREHRARPATVKMRIVRYRDLGRGLLDATERLRAAREARRAALAAAVRAKVLDVNPRASAAAVDAALQSGRGLDAVLHDRDRGSAAVRAQIEDIQARNADIQGLVRSIAELNDMFQDMTLLVDQQKQVINDVEFEVQEVKKDVATATEQLEKADNYQRSARKKKICLISFFVVVIVLIVIGILAYLRANCIIGCRHRISVSNPTAPAPAPAPAQAPVPAPAPAPAPTNGGAPAAGPVSASVTVQRVLDHLEDSKL